MARSGKKRLPHNEQGPSSGGPAPLPPDEPITLTIYLRHRQPVRRRPGSAVDLAELTRRVSHQELEAERKRILKRPVEQLSGFAKQHGMTVLDVSFLRRCVTLVGSVSDVERAFATKLVSADGDPRGGRRHYPARKPKVPRTLANIVHAVVGLDTRPTQHDSLDSHAGPNGDNGLFPSEIARLYGIATMGHGHGQCIGIIAPGGGYNPDDIDAACRAMNVPRPQIADINVGAGRNVVGTNATFDEEVALDIQVVAGTAPQATIAVYFTEKGQPGLLAGLSEAVHGSTARPSVIVITWGQPEESWDPDTRKGFDAVLQDAVRLGITVVASAGDELATDGFRNAEGFADNRVHVDYPASSPYVLACGGTQITLDDAKTKIVKEVVWNDGRKNGTGGGISEFYPVPAFQSSVALPVSLNPEEKRGRGVPDVAAAAAETNGYRIVLGKNEVVGSGTSAVAPLWGAFIALLNEQRGVALGFVNTQLYQFPNLFNRITSGGNADPFFHRGYEADRDGGWSACTGLGTPNGAAIIAALTAVA
jgi:kumamolisin